jgi:hypothetical protein
MTAQWRKMLHKQADLVFTLPCGARPAVWSSDMYEPLIIGVCLPLLPAPPWSRSHLPTILAVAQRLSELWADMSGNKWSLLQQLWD